MISSSSSRNGKICSSRRGRQALSEQSSKASEAFEGSSRQRAGSRTVVPHGLRVAADLLAFAGLEIDLKVVRVLCPRVGACDDCACAIHRDAMARGERAARTPGVVADIPRLPHSRRERTDGALSLRGFRRALRNNGRVRFAHRPRRNKYNLTDKSQHGGNADTPNEPQRVRYEAQIGGRPLFVLHTMSPFEYNSTLEACTRFEHLRDTRAYYSPDTICRHLADNAANRHVHSALFSRLQNDGLSCESFRQRYRVFEDEFRVCESNGSECQPSDAIYRCGACSGNSTCPPFPPASPPPLAAPSPSPHWLMYSTPGACAAQASHLPLAQIDPSNFTDEAFHASPRPKYVYCYSNYAAAAQWT